MSTNYTCADCGKEIVGHVIRFIRDTDIFGKPKAKCVCSKCEEKRLCMTSGVGIAIHS